MAEAKNAQNNFFYLPNLVVNHATRFPASIKSKSTRIKTNIHSLPQNNCCMALLYQLLLFYGVLPIPKQMIPGHTTPWLLRVYEHETQ